MTQDTDKNGPDVAGLTRPIIGIENRTAQEVFDIMCDRFAALQRSEVVGYQNLYRKRDGAEVYYETGSCDVDRLEDVQPWAAEFEEHAGIVELRLLPNSAGKAGSTLNATEKPNGGNGQ